MRRRRRTPLDCRDAFSNISTAAWRQLIDDQDLARLTDNDLQGMFNIMCLLMAASDVDILLELFETLALDTL